MHVQLSYWPHPVLILLSTCARIKVMVVSSRVNPALYLYTYIPNIGPTYVNPARVILYCFFFFLIKINTQQTSLVIRTSSSISILSQHTNLVLSLSAAVVSRRACSWWAEINTWDKLRINWLHLAFPALAWRAPIFIAQANGISPPNQFSIVYVNIHFHLNPFP